MNYYPFHIGDFRSGTVNMSRLSRWIYRDMLDVYYDTERPLPSDFELLCDQIGVEAEDERRIVERLLRLKFAKGEDGYRNETCDRVISEYRARAETAKANGKLGGRPRKQSDTDAKPTGFPSGSHPDADGNPDETRSKANQEPITSNQEKRHTAPPQGDGSGADAPATMPNEESASKAPTRKPAAVVFEHWQKIMGSPRSQFDSKRERVIKAALKAGYSVDDLCKAIDGCSKSPYHMGLNENNTKYNGIDLILRNADYIDKFLGFETSPPAAPAAGSPHKAAGLSAPEWTESRESVEARAQELGVTKRETEHYVWFRLRVIKAHGDPALMERELSAASRMNEAEYERVHQLFYGTLPQSASQGRQRKVSQAPQI